MKQDATRRCSCRQGGRPAAFRRRRSLTMIAVSWALVACWLGGARAQVQRDCEGLWPTLDPLIFNVSGVGSSLNQAEADLRQNARTVCDQFCLQRMCPPADPLLTCQRLREPQGAPLTTKPKEVRIPGRGHKVEAKLDYCPCTCDTLQTALPNRCEQTHAINARYTVRASADTRPDALRLMLDYAASYCQSVCTAIDNCGNRVCDAADVTINPSRPNDICTQVGGQWICETNVEKCKCQCRN